MFSKAKRSDSTTDEQKDADMDKRKEATEPAGEGLPLFFKKPQVITPDRHKTAGVRPDSKLGFARNTNSIVITVAEFAEAAKYYPIVFTANNPVAPVVMVGLEKENYFVDTEGNWKDAYVPAYARQYPFVFLEMPNSDTLTLCIDEGAPHFVADASRDDKALRLFDKEGKPSEFTQNALTFCSAVQQQHIATRRFCETLQELSLLTPRKVDIKLNSGRTLNLGGFLALDQEKVGKLPDDKILALHKQGLLPLIYYALMSESNWRRILDRAEKPN